MNLSKCLFPFTSRRHFAIFLFCFGLFLFGFFAISSIENKKSWKETSIQAYLCYCFDSVPAWDFENNVPLFTTPSSLVLAQTIFFSKTKTALPVAKYKAEGVVHLVICVQTSKVSQISDKVHQISEKYCYWFARHLRNINVFLLKNKAQSSHWEVTITTSETIETLWMKKSEEIINARWGLS